MAQRLGSARRSVLAHLEDAAMSPAAVCPRVTLTIEVSEVLFSAIQITATMSQTTVNAFIGTALRQTQITFFAEASATSESDVVVLNVRPTPPPSIRRLRGAPHLGALQSAILDRLVGSPTGVYDLAEVRRTMLQSHHGPAVSRAVRGLVERGFIESMTPVGTGVRFVRRGAGR